MQYRREIDGLRAVAVIPVILFHAGFSVFSGGYAGVDVFFVISGYLITGIIARELAEGRFSIIRFYERRARRILPALFLVMACTLPFAWAWMAPSQLSDYARSLVAVSLFASNILFWQQSGYFAAAAEEKPLLHTWSLAVEEQYYLLFPLLLLLIWRFGRHRSFLAVAGLAAVSLALSEIGWRVEPSANFYLAPSRFWELLAGSLAALLTLDKERRPDNLLAAVGLALIAGSILFFDDETPFPSLYTLAPVGGTVLVILYGQAGTWVARLLSTAPFVGIGLISYSAYLWHQPLFAFARLRSIEPPSPLLLAVLAAASLGLAWVSWRYVEQPFRRRPRPWLAMRPALFAASAAGGAAFMAAGLAGAASEGFPQRMGPEYLVRQQDMQRLTDARQEAIRAGTCHFNAGRNPAPLDAFLRDWRCLADDEPGLKASSIAVFGDSHSADKVVALREAGIDAMQVGGAGCPLVPGAGGDYYCPALVELFLDRTKAHDIGTILLANRFRENEMTPAYLQRLADYWSARHAEVYLFTPMPEFRNFEIVYAEFGPDVAGALSPDMAKLETFARAARQVEWKNVRLIDTYVLFCGTGPGCRPMAGDAPLLVDYAHLSQAGARLLGERLLTKELPFLPR